MRKGHRIPAAAGCLLLSAAVLACSPCAAQEADIFPDEEITEAALPEETEPSPVAGLDQADPGYWDKVLEAYAEDDSVRQLVLVECTGGSNAAVRFCVKEDGRKGAWTTVFETDGFIGIGGSGKKTEGDEKTPLGDFGIRQAFGILEDPGTQLEYIRLDDQSACCSHNSIYYNQIIDRRQAKDHYCTGWMISNDPEFDYGIATDYNHYNIWPEGSGIFLHCKGERSYTRGCIAIDEDKMKTVLLYADPGMRIIIRDPEL